MNSADIGEWLVARLSEMLGVERGSIDRKRPLAWYGLGSAQAVALSGELEELLGRRIAPTIVYERPTIDALSRFLSGEASSSGPEVGAPSVGEPIAIIGIGCRFPRASGPLALWKLLVGSVDAVTEVPADRWDASAYYDPDPAAPGKAVTKWGAFLDEIDRFDPHFFGIAAAEAERMDPQHRLLMEVSWEALEDAGLVPERLAASSTGVFVGISTNEYGRNFTDPERIDGAAATGNALCIAANRISYTFDLRGPSIAIDTACSSSLNAVHLACRSLRAGESTLALAGGVSLMLSPLPSISFTKAGIMSPDGRCKTFDARANGYVRGEGAGVVVLKPLSRAIADGNPIYAVIRGSAINQDGRSNGLTAPNPAAQEAVLRAAYRDAGVSPAEVQYVEAHGTGTYLGDPIEAKALGTVLSPGRKATCAVGSLKTNIGHLEAAAGIAGLIKVALCLDRATLVPSLHFERPNPQIPFDELELAVQAERAPWPERAEGRLAGVSSFGFGGANVHVVVGEAPKLPAPPAEASARPDLLVLSASSPASLRALAAGYAETLRSDVSLASVAHTAALHRTHHRHRVAVVGRSAVELAGKLEGFAKSGARAAGVVAGEAPAQERRVAFIFSGQASQWPGMGARLIDTEPEARNAIERVEDVVRATAGWSVIDALTDPDRERLRPTEIAQPAIFALQLGLAALWRSWGVVPSAVVGHSVGEIAAACVAGALSVERATRLVVERGRLMQRMAGGEMAAIGISAAEATKRIERFRGSLSIAAHNAPEMTVISGERALLEELLDTLDVEGIYTRMLDVGFAFHSPHMEPIRAELMRAAERLEPFETAIPLYSTVTGKVAPSRDLTAEHWWKNVREPVLFSHAIGAIIGAGIDVFIELGGEPVHSRAVRDSLQHAGIAGEVWPSLKKSDDPSAPLPYASLGGVFAGGGWVNFSAIYGERGRRISGLPSLPFEGSRFWLHAPASEARSKHGLIGPRIDLAADSRSHLWDGRIGIESAPFLRDHAVRGAVVFPAAGYVEIALAAAADFDPELEVRDQVIDEVLLLDDQAQELQVAVQPDGSGDGSLALSIHTRRLDSGARWVRNARARLTRRRDESRPTFDLEGARTRIKEEVDLGELYRAVDAVGLDYGPSFRGLERLWRHEREALGRLRVPEAIAADTSRYRIHPALLDAAFHTIGALRLRDDAGDLFLPSRIETVRLLRAPATAMWSHATMIAADADGFTADVRLFDDGGELLLEALGLTMKRVRGQATHLYRIEWRPGRQREARSERRGRWLLLGARGDSARSLAEQLTARGGTATVLESHVELEQELSKPQPIEAVVHLAALDPSEDPLALDPLMSVIGTCRALAGLPAERSPPRLITLTRGAQRVLEGDSIAVAASPLWGLMRVAALELPELRPLALDLDPERPAAESAAIVRAIEEAGHENQLALRRGETFVPRLVPHRSEPTRIDGSRELELRSDASYLISGGLGALGLLVAERFAARGAKHLLLLGRRGPGKAAASVLDRLRAAGVSVRIASVDVADRTALAAALREMGDGAPPLAGVVHAAGVLDDGPLVELDASRVLAVLAPKALGAWNLHQLVQAPLDFFVLFSSAASVLGSPWQASYAAANAFLDQLAHHRALGAPALSIAWGPFDGAGMAKDTLDLQQERGRVSSSLAALIPPDRGLDTLEALLMQKSSGDLVVLPVDARTLVSAFPRAQDAPLLRELSRAEPSRRRAPPSNERTYPRPSLARPYVAPRDETEKGIAEIWSRALAIEPVGIHDGFFDLGGDSLFAGRIVTQINRRFKVSLGLDDALRAQTVEALAEVVRSKLSEAGDSNAGRDASTKG